MTHSLLDQFDRVVVDVNFQRLAFVVVKFDVGLCLVEVIMDCAAFPFCMEIRDIL